MKVRQARRKPRPANARHRVDTTRTSSGPIWRVYLSALGPGLVTGASDDDPSGIATYAQAGATFGFSMLWAALVTLPLMAGIQEICDRTALATGRGLGELITTRFQSRTRWLIGILLGALIVANALNIAADLVAVGAGMHLLHAGPATLWAAVAGIAISCLVLTGSFPLIARVFKILCLSLFSYLGVLAMIRVRWSHVLVQVVVPHVHLSGGYLALLIAVLGTTISPYLFFWQSLHRLEELRDEPMQQGVRRPLRLARRGPKSESRRLRTARFDVFSGMAFSNVVMFAIIVASAATLGAHGQHGISTPDQAARALAPIAGRFASTIFALGFVGSGVLAIPVLAASGSAGMAGLLHKTAGFSRSFRDAPVFYGLVAVGTIGGTVLSLVGLSPIRLLVFVAVLNGVAAGPFLVVVMLIAGNDQIMGKAVNGRLANAVGWLSVALMTAAAVGLFATGGA